MPNELLRAGGQKGHSEILFVPFTGYTALHKVI